LATTELTGRTCQTHSSQASHGRRDTTNALARQDATHSMVPCTSACSHSAPRRAWRVSLSADISRGVGDGQTHPLEVHWQATICSVAYLGRPSQLQVSDLRRQQQRAPKCPWARRPIPSQPRKAIRVGLPQLRGCSPAALRECVLDSLSQVYCRIVGPAAPDERATLPLRLPAFAQHWVGAARSASSRARPCQSQGRH